jgi:hypothetical protein
MTGLPESEALSNMTCLFLRMVLFDSSLVTDEVNGTEIVVEKKISAPNRLEL